MKHVSLEEWTAYIADEVPEALKIEYENHLYSCDDCLTVYMEAMEREEDIQPIEEWDIADSVMHSIAQIKSVPAAEERPMKTKSMRTITKHYLIAAGFTILLMASGAFQSLAKYVDNVESSSLKESPPVTDGLIDKTFN